ncbi:hypothetical protein Lal_00021407 [Lupinus albus]|nr:hypothetical protein Lal_00021407 [Lupinus albus]
MMNKNKDHDKKNKKPRLAWSEELHRKFVHVVNLLGIESNSPEEWGILLDSRLSERISPKREDQCFEFGNSGSLAQARNGSLEREKAWEGCEILA